MKNVNKTESLCPNTPFHAMGGSDYVAYVQYFLQRNRIDAVFLVRDIDTGQKLPQKQRVRSMAL